MHRESRPKLHAIRHIDIDMNMDKQKKSLSRTLHTLSLSLPRPTQEFIQGQIHQILLSLNVIIITTTDIPKIVQFQFGSGHAIQFLKIIHHTLLHATVTPSPSLTVTTVITIMQKLDTGQNIDASLIIADHRTDVNMMTVDIDNVDIGDFVNGDGRGGLRVCRCEACECVCLGGYFAGA